MKIHLTLPLPPNRANAREHWRVTHRKKKVYYEKAEWELKFGGRLRSVKLPLERPTLTATFYVWSKMDPDNAAARMKFPIDALVKFGLLVDDSEKHLDFTEIPRQVIDRKNPRVEIVLRTLPQRGTAT